MPQLLQREDVIFLCTPEELIQSYGAVEGGERKCLPPSRFCLLPTCFCFLGLWFSLEWCNSSGFCLKYAQAALVVHMAVTVWSHEGLMESPRFTVMGVLRRRRKAKGEGTCHKCDLLFLCKGRSSDGRSPLKNLILIFWCIFGAAHLKHFPLVEADI